MIRRVWVVVLALGSAGSSAWLGAGAWAQATSPGPLAQAHAKLDDQCTSCQLEAKGAADELCLRCHKTGKTSRFHSAQARTAGKTCASCHRDHRGRDFQMVRWTPPKPFPHEDTGFVLNGAHATRPCSACHKQPNKWWGLERNCASCHADPHKPSLGAACADCHSEAKFAPAPRFDHAKTRFPLTGKHQAVACKSCHREGGAQGVWRGPQFATCNACHNEPAKGHAGGQDCAACHATANWKQVSRTGALQLHARTRLPLAGRHAAIACEKCHTPERAAIGKVGGFGPIDPACTTCHVDPHDRRFTGACKGCHGFNDWKLADVAAFDHARTGYKLEGRHKRVACTECHAPGQPFRKRFQRPSGACTDCHKDPHDRPLASMPGSERCETCHNVQGFQPARYGLRDHERTALPLRGVHRVVACSACHPVVDGKPPPLHGTPATCVGCHRDPHAGQFRREGRPQSCSECHGIVRFVPTEGFDHARSAFPLSGAHARVACSGCHFRPAPGRPVQFTGLRGGCEACHKDVHAGQFRTSEPERGCQDCHQGGNSFRIPAFNHTATRFPLDGRHAQVECGKCHQRVTAPGGLNAVVFRLGPMACEDCHHNPHVPRSVPGGSR